MKAMVLAKKLAWQHDDSDTYYFIYALDSGVTYAYKLKKETPASADQTDWETNFMPQSNTAIGYRTFPFATGDFDFSGNGHFATVTAGTTQDIDLLVSEILWLSGGEIYTENAVMGDYVKFQIIDIDDVLGGGPNLVVNEWIKRWYITPNVLQRLSTPYAGEVPALLYMRAKYTSVGATDVKVVGNYYFHKAH